MSDMGEVFKAYKEDRQEKRASNRSRSTQLLEEKGVAFESFNGGAHLVVDGRIDFWPGTGLWIVRSNNERGRGVFKLLKHLGL